MDKLVLCIVGMPGSGKTVVAQALKKNLNAFVVSTGDIVREEIKRRGLPYTEESDKKVRAWFHTGREHVLIERVCKKMKKSKKKILVVEGSRAYKEPSLIKKCTGIKPVVIAVIASFKTRYKREVKRGRFPEETLKYLKERDRSELSFGLGKLIKEADYKINNNKGSVKELERKIVKLVKKLT